jgi:hypothetical protein
MRASDLNRVSDLLTERRDAKRLLTRIETGEAVQITTPYAAAWIELGTDPMFREAALKALMAFASKAEDELIELGVTVFDDDNKAEDPLLPDLEDEEAA